MADQTLAAGALTAKPYGIGLTVPWTAKHSIVVGKAGATQTILAGQTLPGDMSTAEVKRLLELGAVAAPVPTAAPPRPGSKPTASVRVNVAKPGMPAKFEDEDASA